MGHPDELYMAKERSNNEIQLLQTFKYAFSMPSYRYGIYATNVMAQVACKCSLNRLLAANNDREQHAS